MLGYFLIRMLVAGFWPREREGPLVPLAPIRWLAIGVFILAAGRIALNVIDSHVIDIGVAGVVGADRITGGQPLYEGGFSLGLDLQGDVYGPFNYLAYVPFELFFPWDGVWDAGVAAAHAASIAFDLACIAGLVVLGRRLRDGEQGRALGWALAFAWVACPWTLYTMNANANDALIAALGIGALIALGSAPARGVLTGLAAAAKFGPAALAPLFATADPERRWRGALWFSIAFAITAAVVFVPFIPDGGVQRDLRPHARLPGGSQLALQHLGPGALARVRAAAGPRAGSRARDRRGVRAAAQDPDPDRRARRGGDDRRPADRDALVLLLRRLVPAVRARRRVRVAGHDHGPPRERAPVGARGRTSAT